MPQAKQPRARSRTSNPVAAVASPDGAEIDAGELEELAACGCTVAELAAWYRCTDTEIRARLKDPHLGAVWRQGRKRGRVMLKRAQFRLAEKSTTMAIFLGRHLLNQTETVAVSDGAGGGVRIVVDTGIRRDTGQDG